MCQCSAMAPRGCRIDRPHRWLHAPQARRATLTRAARVLGATVADEGGEGFMVGRYTLRMTGPTTIEIMNAGEGGHFDVHEVAAAIGQFLRERL